MADYNKQYGQVRKYDPFQQPAWISSLPIEEIPTYKTTDVAIEKEIRSGKYGQSEETGYFAKCNIFLDNILQKYYDVKIPRMSKWDKNRNPRWDDKPASAVSLGNYFSRLSVIEGSGVKKVPYDVAHRFVRDGKPVMVLGKGHATLATPFGKWPMIYRSEPGFDKRVAVGVKPGIEDKNDMWFFSVEPKEYASFKNWMTTEGLSDQEFLDFGLEAKDWENPESLPYKATSEWERAR